MAILLAGWQEGLGWVSLVVASILVPVFAVLVRHTLAMTLGAGGPGPATAPGAAGSRPGWPATLPLALALAAAALVGLAPAVRSVLDSALVALAGAP